MAGRRTMPGKEEPDRNADFLQIRPFFTRQGPFQKIFICFSIDRKSFFFYACSAFRL